MQGGVEIESCSAHNLRHREEGRLAERAPGHFCQNRWLVAWEGKWM